MTIIIAYKKHWQQLQDQLDLDFDHVFVSPVGAEVDYSADRVIIAGDHPTIADKYRGICNVETITIDEDE